MILYKNSNRQITKNFTEKELFSKSPDAPDSHDLSDRAINGIQIIRDYFGVPVYVTSTYRTEQHNKSIGGASNSQHLKSTAIDGTFKDDAIMAKYHAEIESQGPLYQKLIAAGILGFGLYDNFFHIDSRAVATPVVWDNRKKKISLA